MSEPQQPYHPYEGRDHGAENQRDPYGQPDPYNQADPDRRADYSGQTPQPYPGYASPAPDHPQGTLILVFGIAGFFVGILGPVAWVMGSRALREIRASGVHPPNEQQIVIGRILGIVVTVLLVLGFLLGMAIVVLAAVAAAAGSV